MGKIKFICFIIIFIIQIFIFNSELDFIDASLLSYISSTFYIMFFNFLKREKTARKVH